MFLSPFFRVKAPSVPSRNDLEEMEISRAGPDLPVGIWDTYFYMPELPAFTKWQMADSNKMGRKKICLDK